MQFLETREAATAVFLLGVSLSYLRYCFPVRIYPVVVVPDISPEIKSCQLLESDLRKVRRTCKRTPFLPAEWQLFAMVASEFEFEAFLVNTVWASKGKRLREYRLRQSKEKHTIKKLSSK